MWRIENICQIKHNTQTACVFVRFSRKYAKNVAYISLEAFSLYFYRHTLAHRALGYRVFVVWHICLGCKLANHHCSSSASLPAHSSMANLAQSIRLRRSTHACACVLCSRLSMLEYAGAQHWKIPNDCKFVNNRNTRSNITKIYWMRWCYTMVISWFVFVYHAFTWIGSV